MHDDAIKTGVRGSKQAEDIAEIGSLQVAVTKLREIAEQVEETHKDENVAGSDSEQTLEFGPQGAQQPAQTLTEKGKQSDASDMVPCVEAFLTEVTKSSSDVSLKLKPEDVDMINRFGMKARRLIWSNVTLIVAPGSEKNGRAISGNRRLQGHWVAALVHRYNLRHKNCLALR